jgi:2-amino-4-hydroxy-6-hydroxymethyldihydropteridine diphosphokinase
MTISYIGIGSNLSDPLRQVRTALSELAEIPKTRLIAQSSLYRTPPMGPSEQPDYINAVAGVETTLPVEELLQELQRLEQQHQRQRLIHWGPRTLDLDILLYGDTVIQSAILSVPHPGLTQRIFVVQPLMEIASTLVLPDGRRLKEIYKNLEGESIEQLPPETISAEE